MSALSHDVSFQSGVTAGTSEAGWPLAPARPADLSCVADSALVSAFQEGSLEAFNELYHRHRGIVRAVCLSYLRDADLADEALQETFARAFRELATYDSRRPVRAWLRRVARNHCIDVLRRRRREVPADEHRAQVIRLEDGPAAAGLETVENRAVVRTVLQSLSARDRDLLVLHHGLGVDVETLSRRLGMTTSSVAVALHRARRRARLRNPGQGWVLAPLLLWWRARRHAVERFLGAVEPFGAALQVGVTHVAIAAALSVSSVLAPDIVAAMARQPAAPRAVTVERTTSPSRAGTPPAAPSPRTPASRQSADTSASTGDDGRDPIITPVEMEPVAVPGTDVRVHQREPDGEPATDVGASVKLHNDEPVLEAEWHDDDGREDPLADAACTVGKAGSPVTYCDR